MFHLMFALHCLLFFSPQPKEDGGCASSIYDFKVAGLTGDSIDFAQFKGKKILIVNTASECGFTPQYEGLETLYKAHMKNLVIVGFPTNNFGSQEPGTNQQIAHFCKLNYGVSFPMAAKISVKGDDMAPIYHWLTTKACNHHSNSSVKWNFQKYLINEQGQLVDVFYSFVKPESSAILKAINR